MVRECSVAVFVTVYNDDVRFTVVPTAVFRSVSSPFTRDNANLFDYRTWPTGLYE